MAVITKSRMVCSCNVKWQKASTEAAAAPSSYRIRAGRVEGGTSTTCAKQSG